MNKTRISFPRWLNSKKLFYIWEYDVVLVAGGTGATLFIPLILLSIPVLVSFGISFGTAIFILKKYIKYFKKARKGFMWHKLYSKGFLSPCPKNKIKKNFEESLIPYGFENEFIN